MKTILAFGMFISGLYIPQAFATVAGGMSNLNEVAFSNMAQNKQTTFTIKITPTCFDATEKPVYNPVSPVGAIHFSISLAGVASAATFPTWILKDLKNTNATDTQIVNLTSGAFSLTNGANGSYLNLQSGYAARNLVVLRLATEPVISTADALGSYPSSDRTNAIDYMRFRYDQKTGTPCPPGPPPYPSWCTHYNVQNSRGPEAKTMLASQAGRFFGSPLTLLYSLLSYAGVPTIDSRYREPEFDFPGWGNMDTFDPKYTTADGQISYMTKIQYSSDLKQLNIQAAFPSVAQGWCGSYFCPLMLFFDHQRPSFYGISSFKLNPSGNTNWTEKNAPGYFLALDKNANGVIDSAEELIGEQDQLSNGFEKLKKYDTNNDGKIDVKDDVFKSLVLWQDTDGNGISEEAELHTLNEMGVASISLKYSYDKVVAYGDRAELRESAAFEFKDSKGKVRAGEVIDVWLSGVR